MIEAIAPIVPAVAVVPVTAASNTNNVSAINAFEQVTALQNEEDILNIGNTTSQVSALDASLGSDNSLLDNAMQANLSPQALAIINDANTGASTANVSGSLTTTQLQEIAMLTNDAQMLNMNQDTTFGSDTNLLDGASTVNLSPAAVNILNGIDNVESISVANTLTTAQLQQIAGIVAPFIDEPLTPDVLIQMQNALTAAGFNPTQLSIQNIFFSMNYLAELSTVSAPDAEQLALNEMVTTEINA